MRSGQGSPFWKFGRRFNSPPLPLQVERVDAHYAIGSSSRSSSYELSPSLFAVLLEILYKPYAKKSIHFRSKTNFFFQLTGSRFCFCCFDVFLRAHFYSSAIMKLRIALYLYISIASYMTSRQIVWHNKRINGHGLKIRSCYFFGFQWN